MDYVSITKTNRLFWLGRYYERVSLTLRFIMERYDEMIDTDMFDYHQYCYDLGIPDNYLDSDDFFEKYIFDVDNDFSIFFIQSHEVLVIVVIPVQSIF